MLQQHSEDFDLVLFDSLLSDHSASPVTLNGKLSEVCLICDYNSRNVQALWQHFNSVHISRKTIPEVDFLTNVECLWKMYWLWSFSMLW